MGKEMAYTITEENGAPPDADEWEGRVKSEEDILTWDA